MIIKRLKRRIQKRIARDGRVEQAVVEDIRCLGEHGQTVSQRIEALNVLEYLVEQVMADRRYEGNGLDETIAATEAILRKEADSESFVGGIRVFALIIQKSQRLGLDDSADLQSALRSLQRLGSIAFEWSDERPARKILDLVDFAVRKLPFTFRTSTLVLFELGKEALAKSRFLVAVEALNRLEALTWPLQPLKAPDAAAYLGLIAHFWAAAGSARQRAFSSVENLDFVGSFRECLRMVRDIHYAAARFETADKLTAFLTSVPGEV
jgi:hypothetical protein